MRYSSGDAEWILTKRTLCTLFCYDYFTTTMYHNKLGVVSGTSPTQYCKNIMIRVIVSIRTWKKNLFFCILKTLGVQPMDACSDPIAVLSQHVVKCQCLFCICLYEGSPARLRTLNWYTSVTSLPVKWNSFGIRYHPKSGFILETNPQGNLIHSSHRTIYVLYSCPLFPAVFHL